MGLFTNKEKPIVKGLFKPINDFLVFSPLTPTELALYNDYLTLRMPASKNKTIYSVNYSQINDIFFGVESDIVKVNKSPIGRAVAGGMIFGNTGAIVGAASGIGEKSKTNYHYDLIISYINFANQEAIIPLEDTNYGVLGKKVYKKLQQLTGIKNEKSESNRNVSL